MELSADVLEKILIQIDDRGQLFPEYGLNVEDGKVRLIGHGGFSRVYEMLSRSAPERRYALKVIGFEKHDTGIAGFKNAVNLQWVLGRDDEHIVRIIASKILSVCIGNEFKVEKVSEIKGKDPEPECVVLKFVLMERLEQIIDKDRFGNITLRRKELSDESEVLRLAVDIGRALLTIHDNSCIHRDIKLENIFWDKKVGIYKIGDFGMIRQTENGTAETIIYTDGYGAPEIVRPVDEGYSIKADIYSFGITLYLLLNGLKFPGSGGYYPVSVQYDPEFVFPAPSSASERTVRIVRRMCRYRDSERYSSVRELFAELTCHGYDIAEQTYINHTAFGNEETEAYSGISGGTPENDGDLNVSEKKMKRAERFSLERDMSSCYKRIRNMSLLALTVLIMLFFKGMNADRALLDDRLLWLLVPALMLEAELQKLRELNILTGLVIVMLTGCSTLVYGVTAVHISIVSYIIFQIPLLTLAGSFALLLWLLSGELGLFTFLDYLGKIDTGWIFIVLIFAVMFRFMSYGIILGRADFHGYFTELCEWSSMGMAVAGIILIVLEKCGVLQIPDIIRRYHLVRVGLAQLAVYFILLVYDWSGLDDKRMD